MTLARHAVCFLLGLSVALCAVAVHRSVFPLGLLLALSATFAVSWWLLRSTRPHTVASYVAGWVVLFGVTVSGRPEGDFALAGDVRGHSLMAACFVLVAVGVVSFAGRRGRST